VAVPLSLQWVLALQSGLAVLVSKEFTQCVIYVLNPWLYGAEWSNLPAYMNFDLNIDLLEGQKYSMLWEKNSNKKKYFKAKNLKRSTVTDPQSLV
jgi:hypothetical protein